MKYFLDYVRGSENEVLNRIPGEQAGAFLSSFTRLINLKTEIMSDKCASQSELMLLYYALDHMAEHGEPITAQTAAKCMRTSAPSVSRSLKALSEKGYIERDADKNDRRSVRIIVTPEGEEHVKTFLNCIVDLMAGAFRVFTKEELITLSELQQRFVNAVIDIISEERSTE